MPESSPAPAAILFDLDDTLLDDSAASSAGLRTLMGRLGHPDFASARRLWDVQTELSFGAYIAGRLTFAEQRRERVRALAVQAGYSHVSDDDCDGLFGLYLEAHRGAWRAFHDVAPVLAALTGAGVPLAVVTNGIESLQHDKLNMLGIAGYFRAVVCADTAGVGKPDPRIFHQACHRLGVTPERCWHIGDQLRADALGAISAGMRPLLLDRDGRHAGQGDMAVVTGLDALPAMIGIPMGGPARA